MASPAKAKSNPIDALAPKQVMVYYHAEGRHVFQGSVWLRDIPGALASVAAELARTDVNLVAAAASSIPNTDLAEWAFFAEAKEGWPGLKKTQQVLEGCPSVVKCILKEGNRGMVIDNLHYPLRMSTGEPAMIVSRRTFRDMFDHLLSDFGSGGRVIIYKLGLASGKESYKHFGGVLGRENLVQRVPELISLYTANGWGRVEPATDSVSRFSLRPFHGTLKLFDSFECAGLRAKMPSSDFIRGHIEGMTESLIGKQVKCEETRCVSMGDEYCQFEASEVV
jgi:predicted hydrocarbon binding protein